MKQRVAVALLPTTDSPKLARISKALNRAQDVFLFTVTGERQGEHRIQISKITPLKAEKGLAPTSRAGRILKTYIGEIDWPEQMARFMLRLQSSFDRNSTLAICVGSGVYVDESVLDDFDLSVEDSYTSLYDLASTTNPVSEKAEVAARWKCGIISLVQFEPIFQVKPSMMKSDSGRAAFGRYVVMNTAHFLGTRSFWNELARDHYVKDCLMETSWTDTDYLKSYYTDGLCTECKEIVHGNSEDVRVSKIMGRAYTASEVFASLERMCRVCSKWDSVVEWARRLRALSLSLLGVFGAGLFANVLAGVDTHADETASPWFAQAIHNFGGHWVPLTVCTVSILLAGMAYLGSLILKQRSLLP
jgi:hypothetical protein